MGVGDVGLYRTALTSPSSVKFDDALAHSFDRLEFLGDSVVNLAFKSWVYNRWAVCPVSDITSSQKPAG